jgi:hypothetical protein
MSRASYPRAFALDASTSPESGATKYAALGARRRKLASSGMPI